MGLKQQEKCHQTDTCKDLFSSMLVLMKIDDIIHVILQKENINDLG